MAEPLPAAAAARPKVAVFVSRFTPFSQTFVHNEVAHHQRYAATVFTRQRLHATQFPFAPVHALAREKETLRSFACRVTLWSGTFFRILRDGGFDLVHAHFGSGACYALPYCARLRLPLVVTFHGHDVALLLSRDRFRPANWAYSLCARVLFARADLLLTVSEDLRRALIAAGAPPEKVRVHRLGVSLEEPLPPKRSGGDFVVLMAGRMVEKKGFEFGIEAVARLRARYPQLRLRLVGAGPRRAEHERLLARLGLSAPEVSVRDALPHRELLEMMRQSNVVLVPSVTARNGDREGIPMLVYEAAALAVPVIATRHGGIPEVVEDEKTGLLVPERDPGAIAAAIARLIDHPGLHRSLGAAARHKAENEFDIRVRMRALENSYDEVVASSARRRRGSSTSVL